MGDIKSETLLDEFNIMRNIKTETFFKDFNIEYEFKNNKYYIDEIDVIMKSPYIDYYYDGEYDLNNIYVKGDVWINGLKTINDRFFTNSFIGGDFAMYALEKIESDNILTNTIIGGDILLPQLTIVDGKVFSNRFINGRLHIPKVNSLVNTPIINSVIVGELTLSNSYKRGDYHNILQNVLLIRSQYNFMNNFKDLRFSYFYMNKKDDVYIDVKYDNKIYEDFSIAYNKEDRTILQVLDLSWLNLRGCLHNLEDVIFDEDVKVLVYDESHTIYDDGGNYKLFKGCHINKELILYTNDERNYDEIIDESVTFGDGGSITIVEYNENELPRMITPIRHHNKGNDNNREFYEVEGVNESNYSDEDILKEIVDINKKSMQISVREDNINNDYILNEDYVYFVKTKTLIKHSAIIHFNHDDEEQIINIIYDSGTALKIEFEDTFDLYMGVVNLLIELIFNKENIK